MEPVETDRLQLRWTHGGPLTGAAVATGAFDILHVGHLDLLAEAHRRGHRLVVGVESDARVRSWKGPSRPVNTERDRARMLAALRCVDAVFVIEGDPARVAWQDYLALLAPLSPPAMVITEGDPYTAQKQRATVAMGAGLWQVRHRPHRSTTAIVTRLEDGPPPAP